MDMTTITNAAVQQGIWCVLFCWLFFSTQKKANEREDKLNEKLGEYNKALNDITCTLSMINSKIEVFENKINH